MTQKVLDIREDGCHIVCIRNDKKEYRLYKVYNGHRFQFYKGSGLMEILRFLYDVFLDGADTFPINELKKWVEWYKNEA